MKVTLTVVAGPHKGRAFSFQEHDTFIVGRASYAHFRLEAKDQYFSRAHFMVEVNPPLCRLIDMGSTNGTYVNAERVGEIDLKNGDKIRGGKTVIRVDVEGAGGHEPTVGLNVPPRTAIGTAATPAATRTDALPSPQPTSARATDRLGPYRLVRELGRGGMGVVYLAVREGDNAQVAVKTVQPKARVSPRDVERFLREIAILRSIDHPGIVRYFDAGDAEGKPYLVMEYVDGVDVRTVVDRSGPMAVPQAVDLTCRLLEALDYAHSRRLVHRDIKPRNLLCFREPGGMGIKLADFGLARVYQESKLSGLTFQGELGGTIAYSAPEQITHFREARPASDLYSVGASLYTMLTGCHIYDFGNALNQQILMILQEAPVPIRARRPELPQALADAIHRALARGPEQRFPDARAMRSALLPFRAGAGGPNPC